MTPQIVGIALYVVCLAVIAWYGARRISDVSDYVLGGRRLGWFVTAMSAGATGMSGWLMLGLPGEAYAVGGAALWVIAGLLIGMSANWMLVASRLREASWQAEDSLTLPSFLATAIPGAAPGLRRRLSGVVILMFLGIYTATGIVAGGKLFGSVFGLEYHWGVLLLLVLVVSYSLTGGFFAISWTDVLQALMMILILAVTAVFAWNMATATSSDMSEMRDFVMPPIGWIAIVSGLSWGFGYFGQPHVLARFKAMREPGLAKRAGPTNVGWAAICMLSAVTIGVAARQGGVALDDPETVLLHFIDVFYNPWIGGLALAAVLAAIMSTADSQLLVASAAFTQDLMRSRNRSSVRLERLTLVVIALIAAFIALDPDSTIFNLVAYAWAGLGATFGPSVLLALHWPRLTGGGVLASMMTGAALVLLWEYIPMLGDSGLYVLGPAFIAAFVVAVAVSLLGSGDSR